MVTNDRTVWSVENAGRSLVFDPTNPKDYVRLAGTSGLGLAPRTVEIVGSVSGGGTWRRTTKQSRLVTVPVATYGSSRADVEAKLRKLAATLDDTYTSPQLVATYPDGTQWAAECHFAGGADHVWGSGDTDGKTYCRWSLQLECPSPYFTSRTVTQFPFTGATNAGRGLLRPGGSLSKLRVAGSQTLGFATVQNNGDAEAFPTWRVQGPGSRLTATRAVDGAQFVVAQTFDPSNPVVVDSVSKTVKDSSGTNRYTSVVGAPRFFALPPGLSQVSVVLDNATSASAVTLSFSERRELVF